MPTYEYRCTSCGKELEAVQRFTDDALTECPACGGPLRKLFSAVGVVFKGSGFYKTDSRKSGAGAKPADKSVAASDGDKPAAAKSDGGSSDAPAKTDTAAKTDTPATSDASKSTPAPSGAAG